MVLTIVSFILVLGFLVFVHELGHYWVARRNGIVVEEFGFGYPPRLVKLFRYDGTDFTLNALPFGGFARMKGEDAGDTSPGSFNAASLWARAATLFAGPAANMIVAIILFTASFLAGFPAPAAYAQMGPVAPGSAAAQLGLQQGDVLLSFAGQPLRISDQPSVYFGLKAPKAGAASALTISRQGQIITIPVQDRQRVEAVLEGLNASQNAAVPVLMTQITGIAENSPAAQSGLQSGDIVYDLNNTVVTFDRPLTQQVKDHLGEAVTLTVLRNGAWQQIKVTPRANPPAGQGALGVQIGATTEMASMGFLPSLWEGVRSTFEYAFMVLQLPVMLVMGRLSPAEAQVTGPVGIAQMVGGAVNATIETRLWFPILRLSAILSAALAITNLLPLPALDGGRLIFIFLEMIRGRRVNPEREGLIHMVGFVLLIGLMLLITVRDLSSAPQSIDWIKLMGQ